MIGFGLRVISAAIGLALASPAALAQTASPLYRPQIVRHRSEAYAATAASGSCAARIAAGGRNPCRSISQVSL